jgi:hypothetical protein
MVDLCVEECLPFIFRYLCAGDYIPVNPDDRKMSTTLPGSQCGQILQHGLCRILFPYLLTDASIWHPAIPIVVAWKRKYRWFATQVVF